MKKKEALIKAIQLIRKAGLNPAAIVFMPESYKKLSRPFIGGGWRGISFVGVPILSNRDLDLHLSLRETAAKLAQMTILEVANHVGSFYKEAK